MPFQGLFEPIYFKYKIKIKIKKKRKEMEWADSVHEVDLK
jgi:hypothetical protein